MGPHHGLKLPLPALYVFHGWTIEPLDTKVLHVKRRNYSTINHSLFKGLLRYGPTLGQIAHDAPCETISSTSGVLNMFRWVTGHKEKTSRGDQYGTVFAFLNYYIFRSKCLDAPGGLDKVRMACQLSGLLIV